MAFNVHENAVFIPEFSQISLPWEEETHTLPRLPSLRSLALAPVDKSWLHHCHWQAKGHKPCMLYFILLVEFNVQENVVFIPEFSKISLPWEGETTLQTPLPHPPPARSLRSLALAPVGKSWLHHCHLHS